MKLIILIIISYILINNVQAKEEETVKSDFSGESYVKDYEKLVSTFGIVKSVPNELNDAKSIQELYLKTKENQNFNYHSINYFLKLNNNLKGFSPKGQLIYQIPELNIMYVEYNTTSNIVKRQIIEQQYKELLKQKAALVDYDKFKNKIYYSGVPLLGAYKFDFEKKEKKIIFETQRVNYPAVYINCYKNGEVVGLFYSNGYEQDSKYLPTNTNKTPIVLKFPKEISEKFEYTEKQFEKGTEKNLCLYREKFEDLSNAELYESLINDNRNQFFVFFNIDESKKEYNYLTANVTHMGIFSYDPSDSLHMPFSLWEGKDYNKENVEEIIEKNLFDNNDIKKGFNNTFIKSNYTYVFENGSDLYFMQGIENGNRVRVILNKSSLQVEYKVSYNEDFLRLTLDKIIEDSPNNFPIEMIISKNNNKKQSSVLSIYAKLIDRPHYFKELEVDLKQAFLFDWKKNVETKKEN